MNNTAKILRAASFAAGKHRFQKRKGADAEPYINHPLEVANLLASVGGIEDADIIAAAILHDTIEDTETSRDELIELFGIRVADIVAEVTDDKSLPKAERKRLQIDHAPHLSSGAKLVKLCDKISNVTDVMKSPPADWPLERKLGYVDWAENVVNGVRGINAALEDHFDAIAVEARTKFKS